MRKISNISKISLALLIIALFIFSMDNTISYANSIKVNDEVSSLFIDFMNEAFSNINKFYVTNQDGEDVTDYFKKEVEILLDRRDYKAIQKLIISENLVPYIESTIDTKNNDGLMRASRTQLCSDIITHSYNLQGEIQTWEVLLTGTMTYNPNTGEIYTASSPSLSLYDDSGIHYNLRARILDVQTDKIILSSRVQFYATYRMEARVNGYVPGTDLGPYQIVDFGIYRPQFYAYPE